MTDDLTLTVSPGLRVVAGCRQSEEVPAGVRRYEGLTFDASIPLNFYPPVVEDDTEPRTTASDEALDAFASWLRGIFRRQVS